ncbi:hypothetical protein CY35_05G018500 [Sphagnum magellanicum]|nr:hypothetical protein CY35_05G018500 [Sphagnum magellanicum]
MVEKSSSLLLHGRAFPLSPPSPGGFLGHRGSMVTGDSRYQLPVILGLTTGSTLSSSWEQPAVAGSSNTFIHMDDIWMKT